MNYATNLPKSINVNHMHCIRETLTGLCFCLLPALPPVALGVIHRKLLRSCFAPRTVLIPSAPLEIIDRTPSELPIPRLCKSPLCITFGFNRRKSIQHHSNSIGVPPRHQKIYRSSTSTPCSLSKALYSSSKVTFL
jgi:hypothetical protein